MLAARLEPALGLRLRREYHLYPPWSPWLSSRFSFSLLSEDRVSAQGVSPSDGEDLVAPRLMAMRLGGALSVVLPSTPELLLSTGPIDPIDIVFFRMDPALELLLVELRRLGPVASLTSSSSSSSSRRRFSASLSGGGGVCTVGDAELAVASVGPSSWASAPKG